MNVVDINGASTEQLETLAGVGHCKAKAIVNTRKSVGGFNSVNQLGTVLGVGRCVVEHNKSRLVCTPMRPLTSTSKSAAAKCTRTGRRKKSFSKSTHPNTSHDHSTNQSPSRDSPSTSHDFPHHHRPLHPKRHKPRTSTFATKRRTRSMCNRVSFSHGVETPNDSRIDEPSADDSVFCDNHTDNPVDNNHQSQAAVAGPSGDKTKGDNSVVDSAGESSSTSTGRPSRIPVPRDPSTTSVVSAISRGWSNAERLMALDNLINLCEPTQVRHMMQVIEPQFQRDFISLLPKELALYVLSFLEPRDLLRSAQTCHYWRILAEDKLLWREKCIEENITDGLVYGRMTRRHLHDTCSSPWKSMYLRYEKMLVYGRMTRRRLHDTCSSPWKSMYLRQHNIEHNWRCGDIRSPKVLKGHDDHVITCLEFSGQKIVSGSDDNTLKVWSVLNGKCLRTLVGHTGGVWSSQMQGNTIISGSTDRTLKVWNADSGQCVYTLYGHTSTVRCMHLHGNRVVSGSRDATLRVWDITTGDCLHVLMGHVAAVRCVQYDGQRVVSGAYDFTVKVWDAALETCLHTLQGHTNRVYSLQFDGAHIVSGSLDTSIRVWDVENGNCLHTLIGHQSLTSGMELKDNILVSGNADSTVKVWDIRTGQCLQTLQGPNKHQSAVTCLFQFNKTFVITSSDDGTVKIWDLRTGEFLRNLVSLESGGSGGVVWRVRCSNTKLVCAVGSRNGTEETKLLVLDFDVEDSKKAS